MTDTFEENRRLLFGTAYRMLGSVADAEDIVQDAWLAWNRTDRTAVAHPQAYLVRTVTNLSLNRLTSARAVREAYVGPWLPEPLLTSPDVAEEAELADTVSMAVLVVLETLTPVERAVFLLREVFGYAYAEIAEVVGKSEAAVRQSAHRAREHVRARRPRFTADASEQREIAEKFLAACAGGDLGEVLALLAPDVVSWSDGGGVVSAARRPLQGPDRVARWLLGVLAKPDVRGMEMRITEINGEPGLLLVLGGAHIGAVTFEAAGGRITALRFVVNPQKLRGVQP
ncbi:RNA polymerase sigma-70 factor [Streptomyces sp. NPDC048349]|uniref:RNA polymerase sigma-70 factor n=1 Tax=Streptomyces sp. NPDC048349 TaxID=3155486 RepID=UPI00343AA8F9